MCPNFDTFDSKSLARYQNILSICSFGYENPLNHPDTLGKPTTITLAMINLQSSMLLLSSAMKNGVISLLTGNF